MNPYSESTVRVLFINLPASGYKANLLFSAPKIICIYKLYTYIVTMLPLLCKLRQPSHLLNVSLPQLYYISENNNPHRKRKAPIYRIWKNKPKMVNAPEGLNLAILGKVRRFDFPKMFFLCIPAVLLNFTMFSVISSWIWNFQETF